MAQASDSKNQQEVLSSFLKTTKADVTFVSTVSERVDSIIRDRSTTAARKEIWNQYKKVLGAVKGKDFFFTTVLTGSNYENPPLFQFLGEPLLKPREGHPEVFSKLLDELCESLKWDTSFRNRCNLLLQEESELCAQHKCADCRQKEKQLLRILSDPDIVSDRLFVRLSVAGYKLAGVRFFYTALDRAIEKSTSEPQKLWICLNTQLNTDFKKPTPTPRKRKHSSLFSGKMFTAAFY